MLLLINTINHCVYEPAVHTRQQRQISCFNRKSEIYEQNQRVGNTAKTPLRKDIIIVVASTMLIALHKLVKTRSFASSHAL